MFEAVVYDVRDKDKDDPGSTLGTFENKLDAWEAVAEYIRFASSVLEWMDRAEVILVEDESPRPPADRIF